MKNRIIYLVATAMLAFCWLPNPGTTQTCPPTFSHTDFEGINFNAHFRQSGELWWNANGNPYLVPKDSSTSSIYRGALWMGGLGADSELHLAAQQYSNNREFWSGNLNDEGTTNFTNCLRWDRFYELYRDDVEAHRNDWADNQTIDGPIPESILSWPGIGNPHFSESNGFELPDVSAGLAPFFDRNNNGIYDPEQGDYPLGKGDQSLWWVYNDEGAGRPHPQTGGATVGMEVQVNAFAFSSGPVETETSSFYDFRMIYKGQETLTNFWFSLWVDTDLGCHTDDFVGCNPQESLAYVYNGDEVDEDCLGVSGYGSDIPMLGIKVLKVKSPDGATNTAFNKLMYVNNGTSPVPEPTTDPGTGNAQAFYELMQGNWTDGTPLSKGGDGYNPGADPYDYAFDGNPSDPDGWSACTDNVIPHDRRVLMSFGPYELNPGDITELSFAVVWIPSQVHPCPDVSNLVAAANEMEMLYQQHTEELITSTSNLAKNGTVKVSPNPTRDEIIWQVTIPDTDLSTVKLYAVGGNLVKTYDGLSSQQSRLSIGELANGIYHYRVLLSNGKVAVGRFVKM